jgi:hypothetical protein
MNTKMTTRVTDTLTCTVDGSRLAGWIQAPDPEKPENKINLAFIQQVLDEGFAPDSSTSRVER